MSKMQLYTDGGARAPLTVGVAVPRWRPSSLPLRLTAPASALPLAGWTGRAAHHPIGGVEHRTERTARPDARLVRPVMYFSPRPGVVSDHEGRDIGLIRTPSGARRLNRQGRRVASRGLTTSNCHRPSTRGTTHRPKHGQQMQQISSDIHRPHAQFQQQA